LSVVAELELRGFCEARELQDGACREFRLLVNGVTDYASFLLTPDRHVATWNTGAEHMKDDPADEIIGQHFSRFYPH
jgi:hypothetical protein